MSQFRTQFQRHLFPGLKTLIFDKYKEKASQYTSLFNVEKSDAAFEETRTVAGAGLFVRTPEGVDASQDRFFDGYPKRYNHEDYSLGIGFTWQFLRDIKTRVAKGRSEDLGRSARSTQEEVNAQLLNLAFDSGTLGPDGVPLMSTLHPNIRGGTQSNIISPVSALSVTSYRLALTKFRRFYDDTGVRRVSLDPGQLVVPPELEYEANEITKSAGRPDTANRVDNVSKGMTSVFVYDYLTNTTNWFMLASKDQHFLTVFNREMFHVEEDEDEAARVMWVRAFYAQSYGWSHWMGTVGSNP